jgi:protein-tyrosine phosphatase
MLADYNQIIDGRLWVGSVVRPADARQLQRMGITIVVSLQTDRDLKQHGISQEKLVRELEDVSIDIRWVPVEEFDREDLIRQLPTCVAAVEAALTPAWAKLYLHCSAGIIRSPTVAAAYLMKTYSMPAEKASDILMAKRDCRPDMEVLRAYELTLNVERET